MTPLLLGAAGLVALVAGGLVLRTFGARYRIARLLATTPRVSVAEANELAAAGRRAYVRVDGRIDADEPFEDADHRPLVLRRVRLETQAGSGWRTFEDQLESVPFTVNESLDAIGIDVDALGEGLVVVPRESIGRAADLGDRAPATSPPDTPVRARIEQVSSVEHAIVLGYPVTAADVSERDADARPAGDPVRARMTAGRRRPLILTVLEPPEAMRILAADGEGRTRAAALLLGAGTVLIGGALVWALLAALLPAAVALLPGLDGLVPSALAASAAPSGATGGDPRSDGQGPGLVGTPGLALLGVALIAAIAVALTLAYVRLTGPERGGAGRPR